VVDLGVIEFYGDFAKIIYFVLLFDIYILMHLLEMDEVREDKKWMCPHCVEEKGINPYWICNR
jgi:hypothetical protein